MLTIVRWAAAEKRSLLEFIEASPGFSNFGGHISSARPAQLSPDQSQLSVGANAAEADAERGGTPTFDNAVGRTLLANAVENFTRVVSANVTTGGSINVTTVVVTNGTAGVYTNSTTAVTTDASQVLTPWSTEILSCYIILWNGAGCETHTTCRPAISRCAESSGSGSGSQRMRVRLDCGYVDRKSLTHCRTAAAQLCVDAVRRGLPVLNCMHLLA